MSRARLGVLVSGRGSNLAALLAACAEGRVDAEVVLVASNKPNCAALQVARDAGVPEVRAFTLPDHGGSLQARDAAMAAALIDANVDLVITAGYDRVTHDDFVTAFSGRLINIHPSLLPAFAGGMDAIQQALDAGVSETGVTVHRIELGAVDAGTVLAQATVPIHAADTLDSLTERVHHAEHELLPRVVQDLVGARPQTLEKA